MKKTAFVSIVLMVMFSMALFSCLKEPVQPIAPEIETSTEEAVGERSTTCNKATIFNANGLKVCNVINFSVDTCSSCVVGNGYGFLINSSFKTITIANGSCFTLTNPTATNRTVSVKGAGTTCATTQSYVVPANGGQVSICMQYTGAACGCMPNETLCE